MTLVLTQVSDAGIAMVADSAISRMVNGRIVRSDEEWKKLLWVPRIKAGISYWGFIGKVARGRFDEWLEHRVGSKAYTDLPGLADFLANEMNAACKNVPLGNGEHVGIHVAGYHAWADGVRRPTFYHVHNGHLHVQWGQIINVHGLFNLPRNIPSTIPTRPSFPAQPRTLFARNDDFPFANHPLAKSKAFLQRGYLTRNGDFATYITIADSIKLACLSLEQTPGVRIPSDPSRLGPRIGYLKMELETVRHIYKCSSLPRIVGGTISALGIRPNETKYV